VAGAAMNYRLVVQIMVCLFVGRGCGPTVASVRRVPRSGRGPFMIVGMWWGVRAVRAVS
jgi:hypothetical protein